MPTVTLFSGRRWWQIRSPCWCRVCEEASCSWTAPAPSWLSLPPARTSCRYPQTCCLPRAARGQPAVCHPVSPLFLLAARWEDGSRSQGHRAHHHRPGIRYAAQPVCQKPGCSPGRAPHGCTEGERLLEEGGTALNVAKLLQNRSSFSPPQAQEACGPLEIDSALGLVQSLERDLQEAKAAARDGKLKPLPGETVRGHTGCCARGLGAVWVGCNPCSPCRWRSAPRTWGTAPRPSPLPLPTCWARWPRATRTTQVPALMPWPCPVEGLCSL